MLNLLYMDDLKDPCEEKELFLNWSKSAVAVVFSESAVVLGELTLLELFSFINEASFLRRKNLLDVFLE